MGASAFQALCEPCAMGLWLVGTLPAWEDSLSRAYKKTGGAGVVQTVRSRSSTTSLLKAIHCRSSIRSVKRLHSTSSRSAYLFLYPRHAKPCPSANMNGIVRTNTNTSYLWRRRDMAGLGRLAWPLDWSDYSQGPLTQATEAPLAIYEGDHQHLFIMTSTVPRMSKCPRPAQTRFLCFEDFLTYNGLSTRPLHEVFASREALKADALLLTAAFIIMSRSVANADTGAVAEIDAAAAALGDIILDLHMKVYGSFAQWY
ncbi:uncharacterized protein SCHCODRAFT_02716531 [Schizophyllum commune H4-8]|nr:uncharacterized protein SCHCODRAFT_02716531 [Schizophyllum commune H4-8]KAI5886493.1 hypothetical protein SCHCODRAFT_02716531 [Schizophyllum commune H4-8]